MMNVAIIGASSDRSKFGNKAVRAYAAAGHKVFPVSLKEKEIEGMRCYADIRDIPDRIDRVSVYTPPSVTYKLLDGIAEKKVREVYLNPGAEDEATVRKAEGLGLNIALLCSILAIGQDPTDFT